MYRLLTSGLLFLVAFVVFFAGGFSSRADELDDVTNTLNQQQQQLSDLEKRKSQLSRDISSASLSLSQVSIQLTAAEDELAAIDKDLAVKETELAQREDTRDLLVRQLYKQSRISSFEVILSSGDLIGSARQFQYYNESLDNLSETISQLAEQVGIFQSNQAAAQSIRDDLAALRAQYQATLSSSQRRLSSTSSQLAAIKSTIKNLSARQEQLILEKFAASGGSETVGENPPASEPLPAPGFAPAWMIATYGYPHRIGMSQYGAKGRAMIGQGFQDILQAYYGMAATTANVPATIVVNGCNDYGQCFSNETFDFEEYLKHLYEMPSSWPMEALKAQAVAARTYAFRRGSPICPSTSCQEVKREINAPSWQQAVEATRGLVLGGNNPIGAYYSSTDGGYTISSRNWISYYSWDNGISDFHSDGRAYEVIAGAPWYHTGWGSRNGTSGEYYPWMTEEEFADIFNILLLCTTNGQTVANCSYTPNLSPIDKGGWSMAQVRDELSRLGVPTYTSISAVVTTFVSPHQVNTASVYISGSGGTKTFSGRDFRDLFNLRSRGTLAVKTYRFDIGYCSGAGCTTPDFR